MKFLLPACCIFGLSATAHAAILFAYLPLDGDTNAGGGTAINGTAIGTNAASPTYVAGKLGQAGSFNNSGASGTTPSDWAVSLGNLDSYYTSSFSLSLWVKTDTASYSADETIFGNKNWSSGSNIGWNITNLDNRGLNYNATGGTRRDRDINFNDTNWNLVTVTFDRGSNVVSTYLNGSLLGTNDISPNGAADLGAGFNTLIGGSGNGSFSGNADIDDVALFSGVLTAGEVSLLWNGGAGNVATVVPEPSIGLLGALGLFGLLRRRR